MLVLHYTGMETGQAAIDRLCDAQAGVSAHYVVDEAGQVFALVDEAQRAWHAGKGGWRGMDDINSHSIGIEIINGGHDWPLEDGRLPPYPDAQIAAVVTLAQGIVARHAIAPHNIVGHSDIAPARKQDPGEHFPWARLAQAGLGLFPQETRWGEGDDADTPRLLTQIGYPLNDATSGSADLRDCLLAFQRRFLPTHLTGEADARTKAHLQHVLEKLSKS